MDTKIKAIDIHAIRGITDLQLDLDGKNLIIQGENGTGKSSIVEAIEFFFTGTISHLEGIQGLSLKRHTPHTNYTLKDVQIKIILSPGNISLKRTFTAPPEKPKQFENQI